MARKRKQATTWNKSLFEKTLLDNRGRKLRESKSECKILLSTLKP